MLAARVDDVVQAILPNARRCGAFLQVGSVAGEPGKSLFIHGSGPRAGRWEDAATGEHGDLLDLAAAVTQSDLRGACDWARGFLGLEDGDRGRGQCRARHKLRAGNERRRAGHPQFDVHSQLDEDVNRRAETARRIWSAAEPISGTASENYLRQRGITLELPPTLRHHGALKHCPTGLFFETLVAAVSGPDGKVQAIQRTYLKIHGTGKAAVSEPRLSLGPMGTGAVRLAPAGETLGLAEGVETALSAMELFNVPVWASLSASRLHRIALPQTVKCVWLFADHGGPGIKAANLAIATFTGQGRKVTLRFPPREFSDFNDALQAVAAERRA